MLIVCGYKYKVILSTKHPLDTMMFPPRSTPLKCVLLPVFNPKCLKTSSSSKEIGKYSFADVARIGPLVVHEYGSKNLTVMI